MKSLIIVSLFLISSLSFSQSIDVSKDEPLSSILKRATCEIEVLKSLIILKGDDYTSSHHLLLGVKTRETKVRQIPVGRKILISSMDQYFIKLNDKTIDRACLRKTLDNSDIYCEPLKGITIHDLERQSNEAITVTCRDDTPTDI